MHLALILLCILGGPLQQSVFATAERRELKQNNSTFAICWLVSDPSHRNSDCCLQVAVYPSSYLLLLFPLAAAAVALVSSSVVPFAAVDDCSLQTYVFK